MLVVQTTIDELLNDPAATVLRVWETIGGNQQPAADGFERRHLLAGQNNELCLVGETRPTVCLVAPSRSRGDLTKTIAVITFGPERQVELAHDYHTADPSGQLFRALRSIADAAVEANAPTRLATDLALGRFTASPLGPQPTGSATALYEPEVLTGAAQEILDQAKAVLVEADAAGDKAEELLNQAAAVNEEARAWDAERRAKKAFYAEANRRMQELSGNIIDTRLLTAFLYRLLRDHLPPGLAEELVRDMEQFSAHDLAHPFTNGWLARYAGDLADRLTFCRPDGKGDTGGDL